MEAFKDVGEAQHLSFLRPCLVQHHHQQLRRQLDQQSTLPKLADDIGPVVVYQNTAVIPRFR